MKRFSYIIVIILINLALCAGCSEDNPAEPVTPDQPGSLILEGKMTDWNYGADKQLRFGEYFSDVKNAFALGTVNADGSFRIAVPPPSPARLSPVTQIYDAAFRSGSLVISDTTAKFYAGEPILFDGAAFLGGIFWSDILTSLPDQEYWEYYSAAYYYFDKDVTVKGTVYGKYGADADYVYDFAAKAGWNKLLIRYQSADAYTYSYINEKPVNGAYLFNGVTHID